MSTPVLVLGATGGQGGAVVDALEERGVPVRALVRRRDSDRSRALAARGVELVTGDLGDLGALVTAMDGARAAFAVTTPFESGPQAEVEQGRTIVAAAREARLPHLLLTSVAGADAGTGVPHFESKGVIESELRASGLHHGVVAPAYFFDNALGGLDELRAGVLRLPLDGDHRLQQVARADLAAVSAIALIEPDRVAGRRVEIAGDAPSPHDMASVLSTVLGREVRHEQHALADIADHDMHAMWTFLSGPGYRVDLDHLRAEFPEVTWTTFADWAHQALDQQGRS